MKKLLVVAALFLFISNISKAQTIAAVVTSDGKTLTATTRATPPVNMISMEEISTVTSIILLDEKTMKSEGQGSVYTFAMTVVTSAGKTTLEAKGGMLSATMKTQLQKLNSGDKVYFEYIKCIQGEGTIRAVSSLAFQVK